MLCRLRLLPLLALLCLLSPAWAEEEHQGIAVLEWSIRQDIEDALTQLSHQQRPLAERLDRLQGIIAAHGQRLFRFQGRFIPVYQGIQQRLEELDLLSAYQQQFSSIAERALEEAAQDPQLLERLAQQYPYTPAAKSAWRRLADRAWDYGQLGLYLSLADRAQEGQDPLRAQRVAAARRLLTPATPAPLAGNLPEMGRMWGLSLPELAPGVSMHHQRQNPMLWRQGLHFVDEDASEGPLPLRLSRVADNGILPLSDGRSLLLIDPLVGSRIGDPLRLGSLALLRQPAVQDGRVIAAVGLSEGQQYNLVAADSDGRERWRQRIDTGAHSILSAPAIVDQVIAIALVTYQDDGAHLRVLGYHSETGAALFDTSVAKHSQELRNRFSSRTRGMGIPQLIPHAGLFAVAGAEGPIATLGPDGQLQGLWLPTAAGAPMVLPQRQRFQRQPRLLSDGRFLVFVGQQNPGITIIDSAAPDPQQALRQYHGDGATDALLACSRGQALLAGRNARLLDLEHAVILWSELLPRAMGMQAEGSITSEQVVLLQDNSVLFLDPELGSVTGERRLSEGSRLALAGGVLLEQRDRELIGYGDREAFMRDLQQRMAQDPEDYRPYAALYALHRAEGDLQTAYDFAWQALQRGAPERFAEEAAQLIRRRLSLQMGSAAFNQALTQLEGLQEFLPRLGTEVAWWQGRHYEQQHEAEIAIQAYRRVLTRPSVLLRLPGGLHADLHALAEAGLHRLGAQDAPAWLGSRPAKSSATGPQGLAWSDQRSRLGSALFAGTDDDPLLISYAEGDVIAQGLQDGSIRWRRPLQENDPPLLGVRFQPRGLGVSVDVIPGSAAAAAGLRNHDRIVAFDNQPVASPSDLVHLVASKQVGDPFQVRIQRGGNNHEEVFTGQLGLQLYMPLSANQEMLVLARASLEDRRDGSLIPIPDPMNPELRVLRLSDGAEIWRRSFAPLLNDAPPEARLSARFVEDYLLIHHDGSLEAFHLGQDAQAAQWSMGVDLEALEEAVRIDGHLLAINSPSQQSIRILDLQQGRMLFEVPGRMQGGSLLIDQGDLLIGHPDQGLHLWDLGRGMRRWFTAGQGLRAFALRGDQVFAQTAEQQVSIFERASGDRRRRLAGIHLVDQVAVQDQVAYLQGYDEEQRSALFALGLDSGTLLWKRRLPPQSTLRDRIATFAWGMAAELVSADADPALLSLDRQGQIRYAIHLPEDGHMHVLDQGVLLLRQDGIELLSPQLPDTPPALQVLRIDSNLSLDEALSKHFAALSWQQLGNDRWALAQHRGLLVVISQLDVDSPGLRLYLGEQGPAIDTQAQRLRLSTKELPQLNTRPEGRRMQAFIDRREEPQAWQAVTLAPPLQHSSLLLQTEVLMIAEQEQSRLPWWLRKRWQRLEYVDSSEDER